MNSTQKAREIFIRHDLGHIWNQYGTSIEQAVEELEKGADVRSLLIKAIMTGVGTMAVLRDTDQREAFLKDFFNEVVMPIVQEFDTPETMAEVARLNAKARARAEGKTGGETKH